MKAVKSSLLLVTVMGFMGFIVALSLTPRPDYPWTPPPRA
jgi:hypothetical protein